MGRYYRRFRWLLLLALSLAAGCQTGMRIAHLMVEGEAIGRDFKQLNRAVDAEVAGGRDPG